MVVYVSDQGALYIDEIVNKCTIPAQEKKKQSTTESSVSDQWKPLVILIPLRLGLEKINPIYKTAIRVL